jgi:hypothetical protein
MKIICSMALAVAVVASACSEATAPGTPITDLPRALSASETALISGSNAFAFDLFRTGNLDQH